MKTLNEFLNEELNIKVNEGKDSKTITFNFAGLDNSEDTLKSFDSIESCEVEDQKLKVTITKDNASTLNNVQDILQQYAESNMKSQHRSSDEQYAQKVKSFSEKVNEFNDTIEEFMNPTNDEDKDKNKNKEEE